LYQVFQSDHFRASGFLFIYFERYFTGLANKTFVLRDSSAYALRSILGMILGYIIPHLYGDSAGLLTSIAVPFLAGYAVEPMFAALDNVVLTLRDAVSRTAAPGDSKAK
jgi:hypothetical protein